MVVYTHLPIGKREGYNNYWKLESNRHHGTAALRARLRHLNYKFQSSANKDRLIQLLSRHGRGLLSYDAYRVDELRTFCQERGLLSASSSRPQKVQMILRLETADEMATFERFMNLPPELRVLTYTIYFKSLPALSQPVQPPISKVSTLIRKESLPTFFKTCNFVFDVTCTTARPFQLHSSPPSFFSRTDDERLKQIRHLTIDISIIGEEIRWQQGKIKILGRSDSVERRPCPLATAVSRYLEGLANGSKETGLTRADFDEVRRLMHGGPYQLTV